MGMKKGRTASSDLAVMHIARGAELRAAVGFCEEHGELADAGAVSEHDVSLVDGEVPRGGVSIVEGRVAEDAVGVIESDILALADGLGHA